MKPVAVFRHTATEGPGYFATFLERRRIPWTLVAVDAQEPIPGDPGAYSGLVFMGGPMSVNDDLPWIPRALELIRAGVARELPVLGHCLGGQLMARALGGTVGRNPVKEIGWGEVRVVDSPTADRWFGPELRSFNAFHWHGETFSIPAGAERVLESPYCANQAFVLGPHLGLQCHVEMTAEMVLSWSASGAREIAASPGPSVQTGEAMQEDLPSRLAALHAMADRLYSRWVEGLCR